MRYRPPTHQAEEIKPKEGANLPQEANTKEPTNNLSSVAAKLNDIIQKMIRRIEAGYQNDYNIILHDVKTKKPNWLGMKASDYKADLRRILDEYMKTPLSYGYGVVVGPQLNKNLNVIAIDIDIDTTECKERISKRIEALLNKHEIKYYKEITQTGRIHYYIIVDKITDKMESISKLPYRGNCFKLKDGKELPGEIEIFTKKNKYIAVYNGRINDMEPFFEQKPEATNHQKVDTFLEEWLKWIKAFGSELPTPDKEPIKEPVKEPDKEHELPHFTKIVEAYKIIRKHRIVNGWEIEKVLSAYCIRENIAIEQALEGFKAIYESEYDEKRTIRLLNNTKNKDLELLPNLRSVYYHISLALDKYKILDGYEKELLESVLDGLKNIGYSNYKLPEYLEKAENIYLHKSIEHTSKDNNTYYKESYFIEQNLDGIKEVVYVSIITPEYQGIYKFHKLEQIKEVGIKTDIIRLVKDGKIEAYEYLINDKVIYKPSFNYSKFDDIIHEIELISMKYTSVFDINLYKRYLKTKIKNYIKKNGEPIPCVIGKTTGWSDDLRFFYHYSLNDKYHELHPDHVLYRRHRDLVKEKDKQHKLVKAILQEGKLLGVLLTASVASLFIKPFKLPGVTYIISGNSGAGKTTSSLIATSLFYYSDDHLMDAQTTKTGLELTISSLNSLPVLVDEGALAGVSFSLQDLVFMVSSGKGKTRGRKDLTVDFKELKSNVFWTTETTEIDELRRTGAFRRTMYLVVSSWDEFTSLFQSEDRINEQYAGCGIDYIQYLIDYMEDVKKAFKEQTERLNTEYKDITTIALNIYAGLILLEAFYNTKFNELRKTINKLLREAKARFIDSRDNVIIQVMDYLESIAYQKFHIIDKNNKDEIDIRVSRNETCGEYDKINGIYCITGKGIKEIADKLGKNRHLLLQELEKAGVLIAKNVPYYMKATGQTVKVYKIKFSDMKENEPIDPEAVETEEKTSYEKVDIIQEEREQELDLNIEELDIPF
jgi:hypothetical protein